VVCCINNITWIKLLFSCLSKVLVCIYRNTWCHIPEDHTLDTDLHMNFRSHLVFIMRVTKLLFTPFSTMPHCTTPHLLYCSAPLYMAQNCFTPHCTALYVFTLHCCMSLLMSGNCCAPHRTALFHRWDCVLVSSEDDRTKYKV
jgi:hypothetical protein